MRKRTRLGLILFALVGAIVTVGGEAFAIIGMPLTPMSYAGVARRSVRRARWGVY
jgi:hypothetical protein